MYYSKLLYIILFKTINLFKHIKIILFKQIIYTLIIRLGDIKLSDCFKEEGNTTFGKTLSRIDF